MLLLSCALTANAQQRPKKMAEEEPDTIPLLKHIAVSVDLVGPIQWAVSTNGQVEAQLRIDLKDKYYPVLELGYGHADASEVATGLHYKTNAPYGRIGMDWNLLKNKHDVYRLFAGFRYAFTSYKFDVNSTTPITDPTYGGVSPYEATGISASYHWLEGVMGIDAKIWGPIHFGWSFRYRRRIAHKDGDIGNTWYVPGFGKQGASRMGLTFNVGVEF